MGAKLDQITAGRDNTAHNKQNTDADSKKTKKLNDVPHKTIDAELFLRMTTKNAEGIPLFMNKVSF
ncbi:MAG: hypothetical protein A2W17_12115 [Planctomycetes bacterium RBG_16_41_13]|nr:MAG: hypothetical protein A2W17_12115 [Planctomycetes bacterium RBG_16_41_13]